jgi:hypothetical protein
VENNPPGDIPDNLAFVGCTNKAGGYSFTHPEGWARTGTGTRVAFTDKLNGVGVDNTTARAAPTTSSARPVAKVGRYQAHGPAERLECAAADAHDGGGGARPPGTVFWGCP